MGFGTKKTFSNTKKKDISKSRPPAGQHKQKRLSVYFQKKAAQHKEKRLSVYFQKKAPMRVTNKNDKQSFYKATMYNAKHGK